MTRLEWKLEKIKRHIPYNLETLRILMLVILIVAGVTALAPITYSMATESIQAEIKQNAKEQQDKLLEEQKQKEIDKQIEEDKKQKEQQKKKAKEEHDTSVYYFKKSYQVGDRIKILDMNYTVPDGDSFRFSVGDIDVIAAIDYENLTMQGESGYTYCYGVQVQKVQSKREWRDLVEMKDRNQLKFYEVNENE